MKELHRITEIIKGIPRTAVITDGRFSGASGGLSIGYLCPEAEDPSGNPNSAAYGVLGVIPGMIGCMQAAEVLKLLLGKGEPLIGKMLFIDAKTWSTDLIEVPVHPQCSCHAHTKVHRT